MCTSLPGLELTNATSQYVYFVKPISAWNGLYIAEAPSLAEFRSTLVTN